MESKFWRQLFDPALLLAPFVAGEKRGRNTLLLLAGAVLCSVVLRLFVTHGIVAPACQAHGTRHGLDYVGAQHSGIIDATDIGVRCQFAGKALGGSTGPAELVSLHKMRDVSWLSATGADFAYTFELNIAFFTMVLAVLWRGWRLKSGT